MSIEAKKNWSPEEMAELRAKVKAIQEGGVKLTQIAAEVGIPYGTFTSWNGGTYAGDNDKIATAVEKWLMSREDRARTAAILPTSPGFQRTPTAEKILALLNFCHHAPDLGVLAGGAGIGKTTAIEEYQRRASNVFIVTAEPVSRSAHAVLQDLAEVIGVVEKSTTRLSRAIQNRLRNTNALIIVDEAQHLPTGTLDQLRSLHDRAGCGLVLSGNQTVYSRLAGGNGKPEFAQLFSRVGMRINQDRPTDEDVAVLSKAWGVEGPDEVQLLRAISKKPGALRGVAKTIRLASVVAAGRDEHVSVNHIKAAWNQRGAESLDANA